MANSNNSTSLYSFASNTVVSKNDYTTLYNTTPGNVVNANVPDRNFTTLYTKQTEVRPTYPYGNANVEAFLNVGSDTGGNQVQNIVMHGNITVAQQSYLGNIGNVHITGGQLNYILQTDGGGNLNWAPLPTIPQPNVTLYIHFDVTSTGNNQTFTNGNLVVYANSNTMAVFKNGINIEPSQYDISGSTLTINIPLNTGDTIDVLPSTNAGGGGGSTPGGNITDVQYNGGGVLAGNASFTFDQANSLLSVGNVLTNNIKFNNDAKIYTVGSLISITSNANNNVTGLYLDNSFATLYANSNVAISSNGYVSTHNWIFDNTGNLVLPGNTFAVNYANGTPVTLGGGGGTPAGSNTFVQYNDNGNFGANANFTFDSTTSTLTVPNIVGNISYATTAGSATTAGTAVSANLANYAINVTGNSQPNITSLGQLYNVSVGYSGIVDFTNTSNVSLGSVYNLHITGGSGGQFLTTNGYGSLQWQDPVVANANYASYSGTVFYTNAGIGSTSQAGWATGYQGAFYLVGDNGNRAMLVSASTDGNLTLGANLQYSTGPTQKWVFTSTGNLVLPGNTWAVNFANGTTAVVANANYATTAGTTNAATYASIVTGGTQSNITSLGTLTSLTVSGNTSTGNISSSGKSTIFNTQLTKFEETNINGGSVSGTITPDAAAGTIYFYTLTGNITLNSLANVNEGSSMTIVLTQDGTGGRTLSSTMKFAGGSKTLSTTPGASDVISLFYNNSTYYAVLSKGYV